MWLLPPDGDTYTRKGGWHLADLEVIAPQGELSLDGDVKIFDDYPMNLTVSWRADIDQSAPLQGEGTLAGRLVQNVSILSYILLGQPLGTKFGSYTLGKYLTRDLYVSYGIGLFDALNTFNMRYKLTDKLAMEAESGSGSGADLIYTIEK